eukprot:3243675-Pyramimonas_sp.AAC.1
MYAKKSDKVREEPAVLPSIAKSRLSAYKEEKEAALKADAHNPRAWNSLFMRADTVAAAAAAHFGVRAPLGCLGF